MAQRTETIFRRDADSGRLDRGALANVLGLAGWLIITFAVSFWAAQFMPGDWYAQLEKPAWNPPNWVFGPVWGFLYAAMAVAAWLVWRRYGFIGAGAALALYFIQLALNGIWSWLFFGQHLVAVALLDIFLLLAAIILTMILFWRRVKWAGVLFVPYVLWVAYASTLNFGIMVLN